MEDCLCHQDVQLILFAIDYLEHDIIAFEIPIAKAATYTLKRYGPVSNFKCKTHRDWGFKILTKIIINIFFNNKQMQAKDLVRKETLSTLPTDKGQRSKLITRIT